MARSAQQHEILMGKNGCVQVNTLAVLLQCRFLYGYHDSTVVSTGHNTKTVCVTTIMTLLSVQVIIPRLYLSPPL